MTSIKYQDVVFEDGRYKFDEAMNLYDYRFKCWLTPHEGTRSDTYPDEHYLEFRLWDIDGKLHRILYHRLVAATFIGDVTGMEVHHKDEHPTNCHPDNLEILTTHDHQQHHYRGASNPRAQLCDEDVHDICRMLQDGMAVLDIADVMTEKLGESVDPGTIGAIRRGTSWSYISKDYEFYRGKLKIPGRKPDETIYGIPRARFEYLAAHVRLSQLELAKIIGLDISDKSEMGKLKSRIGNARTAYDSRMYKLIRKKQPNTD